MSYREKAKQAQSKLNDSKDSIWSMMKLNLDEEGGDTSENKENSNKALLHPHQLNSIELKCSETTHKSTVLSPTNQLGGSSPEKTTARVQKLVAEIQKLECMNSALREEMSALKESAVKEEEMVGCSEEEELVVELSGRLSLTEDTLKEAHTRMLYRSLHGLFLREAIRKMSLAWVGMYFGYVRDRDLDGYEKKSRSDSSALEDSIKREAGLSREVKELTMRMKEIEVTH